MTAIKTEYKYIHLDEKNVPIITGSTMKVVELITSVKAYGKKARAHVACMQKVNYYQSCKGNGSISMQEENPKIKRF
jgi:hypothetical protein